jgi:hypothetical protein
MTGTSTLRQALFSLRTVALIEFPRVLVAEINPCIVTPAGAVAVDALVTLG